MSRARFVWDRERQELVPAAEFHVKRRPAARSDFPTPMLARDYAAYDCPITGRMIDGKREHRENLERHGCRILEPGETQAVAAAGDRPFVESTERILDRALGEIAHQIDYSDGDA